MQKLNPLSGSGGHSTCSDQEWTLVLIDCDNVGILLHNKKISMKQAQNSINLVYINIRKHVNENNNDTVFGYHLGSDLFALFVYDNASTMNKSIEIVESLLNVMRNKQKSSFMISVGIGARMIKSENNKDSSNIIADSLKREWVSRAYTNLSRAKENGKNCYFNIQNDIDLKNDDKKLRLLTAKVDQLYAATKAHNSTAVRRIIISFVFSFGVRLPFDLRLILADADFLLLCVKSPEDHQKPIEPK